MKRIMAIIISSIIVFLLSGASIAENIDYDSLSVDELNGIIREAHNAILKQAASFDDKDVLWNEKGNVIIKIQSCELADSRIIFNLLIIDDSPSSIAYSGANCVINGWKVNTATGNMTLNAYERTKTGLLYVLDIGEAEIESIEQINTMKLSILIKIDGKYN